MSRRKQLKEMVLSAAIDYLKEEKEPQWFDQTRYTPPIKVSPVFLKDLVEVLTKKKKGNSE